MRDLSLCLSEYAVQISDPSCTSYTNHSCVPPQKPSHSTQNTVACLYKTTLSNHRQMLITVTWCKSSTSQLPSITLHGGDDDDPGKAVDLFAKNPRLFRKKKGRRSVEFGKSKVEIVWDFSSARYDHGSPEPVHGYYVFVTFDSVLGLVLGDMSDDAAASSDSSDMSPRTTLVSRREHFSAGSATYSTRAKFRDAGAAHEILIRCSGENEMLKCAVLSVSIDRKTVVRVKRLQWNFRGNQSIFVDGLVVDMMWDVRSWLDNPASGSAVFMFRTRSGMDSRLWLEERRLQKEEERVEFSLLICACKS